MDNLSPNFSIFYGTHEYFLTEHIKIFNVSDSQLDKIIIDKKGLNGITYPIKETCFGRYKILNPDVLRTEKG